MQRTNMHMTELDTIDIDILTDIEGGDSGGFWQDMQNVGKATVNGGGNALNFLNDHPVELGKCGTYTIGGSRIEKPFKNDPLSQAGHRTVSGTPHPARH